MSCFAHILNLVAQAALKVIKSQIKHGAHPNQNVEDAIEDTLEYAKMESGEPDDKWADSEVRSWPPFHHASFES